VRSDCKDFRAALEAELLGRPSQEKLVGLSWHAHLLSCGDCRNLLEKEEALEALLASLPEPRLPAALARRVLVRLRADRAVELRLDSLLDLDRRLVPDRGDPARAREDLATDILARLAPERAAQVARTADARLDALLELDREIEVPDGLSSRVLRRLDVQRRAPVSRWSSRLRRSWIYAAAAGLLVVGLVLYRWSRTHEAPAEGKELVVQGERPPDPQMLAALDVLEQWDLLMQDDVDVLLSTLGPADEALLDYR
jgi:hypothetical protein